MARLKIGFIPIEGGTYYEEALEEVTRAEELGFDSVWMEEHHSVTNHYWPSPPPVSPSPSRVVPARLRPASLISDGAGRMAPAFIGSSLHSPLVYSQDGRRPLAPLLSSPVLQREFQILAIAENALPENIRTASPRSVVPGRGRRAGRRAELYADVIFRATAGALPAPLGAPCLVVGDLLRQVERVGEK